MLTNLKEVAEFLGMQETNNDYVADIKIYTVTKDTEQGTMAITLVDMETIDLQPVCIVKLYRNANQVIELHPKYNPRSVISCIEKLYEKYFNEAIFENCYLKCNDENETILAAVSTRELTKNMVKVRSSNLWSVGINIKNRKDKFGDMFIQFKADKTGGPGDIYQYFDVPVNLYRKFIGTTSLGAFFWRYIRNTFKYRKLTGNRRGVLPNAIN